MTRIDQTEERQEILGRIARKNRQIEDLQDGFADMDSERYGELMELYELELAKLEKELKKYNR